MTGESVKDCRYCNKCNGYHPPNYKCAGITSDYHARTRLFQKYLGKPDDVLRGAIIIYEGTRLCGYSAGDAYHWTVIVVDGVRYD